VLLQSISCFLCFCFVLCIVSPFVYICLFPIPVPVYRPLPPGGNPVGVYKYHLSLEPIWKSPCPLERDSLNGLCCRRLCVSATGKRDFKWHSSEEKRQDSVEINRDENILNKRPLVQRKYATSSIVLLVKTDGSSGLSMTLCLIVW